MSNFKVGDVVRWNGNNDGGLYPIGTRAKVVEKKYINDQEYLYVKAECDDQVTSHYSCRWDKVESEAAYKGEVIVQSKPEKTGGSTPNQYRLSINLPLTSDRTQFVDIDLEAMDVIDALDLSGNLKDVQKALFRMGKKQDTPVAYDLNKCLFYILREMKKRGTISHAKFWEVSGMLDNVLKAEDVK